ncbi:MAG: EAL domain-containing protein [Eubacteriales bacterium]|jgi:EAL domain-containing protein (putative c-di-GMP-specific phosphodiesterase class I)/GGDEF domain-containing protein/predicted transcriptional regulator
MARRRILGGFKKTIFRSTMVRASVGALIVVSAILIIYFSSATTVFLGNIEDNTKHLATAMASSQAEEINTVITRRLAEYVTGLAVLDNAGSIQTAAGSLSLYLDSLVRSDRVSGIVTARYFRDGKEYYSSAIDDSFMYTGPENDLVLDLVNRGVTGTTAAIYEADTRTDKCMAFVVATPKCEWIDSVVIYVRMDILFADISAFAGTAEQNFEYACIASGSGSIVRQTESGSLFDKSRTTNNLITLLNEASNDKESVNRLLQAASKGEDRSELLKISGETYAVAFSPVNVDSGKLYVAKVYNPDVIFRGSYEFTAKLGGAVVMLVIIITIMFAVVVFMRGYYKRQLYKSDNIDPIVGCRSYKKFTIDAEDLISINRTAGYAMLCIAVENLTYIKNAYGEDFAVDVLQYIGKVLDKFISNTETFSYVSDNKFSALIRYNDTADIINRVKLINALVVNYPGFKNENYAVRVGVGIYPINRRENLSIQQMLEKAMLAHRMKLNTDNRIYIFYEDSMGEREEREREMEGKMEQALKNGDFQVFFQPKLDIKHDRLEGAEALVRLYDPQKKTYILPNNFVSLFENNGFISKLDGYVYEQVCKYLHHALVQGYRIVPVSVNVSRVTAMQEGFLDFYINTKKKYQIADGYIMIEFTESFAQENYEELRRIILRLRSEGFKCSIDDFGSGYASYSILKELPMDELKLDQFFIKPGMDPKKDDTLLRSIIKLADDLGMKTTQEGVETYAEVERLKQLGCTTIQGYYYSKPISMYDYIDFVNTHTQKRQIYDTDNQ